MLLLFVRLNEVHIGKVSDICNASNLSEIVRIKNFRISN